MKCQRSLFKLDPEIHYLNCAFKSPLLSAAEDAAVQALIRERNPYTIKPKDFFTEVDTVKGLFGKIVNCKPSEVALAPSTSYIFASLLNNIPCKTGQHAITIMDEFPSDFFAVKRWCDSHHTKLKIIRPKNDKKRWGKHWNKKIIESINTHTSVVILSSVHWMSGLKFDLKKIGERCRQVGAAFIVDGTQSVGAIPMDVEENNIDALVCAGYKWLFGPYSTCLAYVGMRFHKGMPIEESWMNRTNAHDFSNLTNYENDYWPHAGRFNVGQTSNFILMPMLRTALEQILNWGVENIQTYAATLLKPLKEYLIELDVILEKDAYMSDHLFGLKLPESIDVELLKKNFNKNNVIVSVRGSYLRVAVNVFNSEEDIQTLINTIEKTRLESVDLELPA